MLLSSASPLLPGLPFALFTQSMHFIPQSLVRESSVPVGILLQKYYFVPDIDSLRDRADEARSFGSAAAEEWFKGLNAVGEAVLDDAARFEQWEINGGLVGTYSALARASEKSNGEERFTSTPLGLPPRPPTSFPYPSSITAPPGLVSNLPPMPSHGLPPGVELPSGPLTFEKPSDSVSMSSQHSTGTNRPSKGNRERARIRSQKKADIIERCMKLSPPIYKDMLEQLEAFDAALKVPIPLNDNSWEILRDRLLQQRHKALLEDEARNTARRAPIPGQFRPPSRTDEYILAHADTPRKERLCQIAEEFIKQKWGHGGWVTYPDSPRFAAEVLIHTRHNYLYDQAHIARLQASTGYMTLSTPREDNLKLEDMKWVFEQTIKPRTEQIRKDLFLCPICPQTGTVKYFAFESIIQHYASKHTTAFSHGAQKVSWKADWPDTPPFNIHPERVYTPPPSITHTSTLSHTSLPTVSSGSMATSTVPSRGRNSPDTMSLVSNSTHTFSVSGHMTKDHNTTATAPGIGMYEVQRNDLASGLVQGWQMVPSVPPVPNSLQLYLAIAFAISDFGKKYSNPVSLDLFSDCLNTKAELKELKTSENLRCAECMVEGRPEARASWGLTDLMIHFKKAHIDQNRTEAKFDWKNEMIALPEPALIRSFQPDLALPVSLRRFLEEAAQTSAIQSAQSGNYISDPRSGSRVVPNPRYPVEWAPSINDTSRYSTAYAPGQLSENQYYVRSYPYPQRGFSSVAATYGDRSTTNDLSSTTSRTISGDEWSEDFARRRAVIPSHERHHLLERFPKSEQQLPNTEIIKVSGGENPEIARGEAMTRSNTVISHRSRGEQRPVIATEDLLGTIDAHVDVEMADSGLNSNRSARTSRPSSRSSGAVTVQRRTGQDSVGYVPLPDSHTITSYHDREGLTIGETHHYELQRRASDRVLQHTLESAVRGERMEREPSRVIEFNHDGTPIPHEGRAYHEVSPSRHFTGAYDRHIQHSSPYQSHDLRSDVREVPVETVRYSRGNPQYAYQTVEYVPTQVYRATRNYESATSHHHAPELSHGKQYVEIGDGYPRTQTLYDQNGQPVQFREVDPSRYLIDADRYERYKDEHDERRFVRR